MKSLVLPLILTLLLLHTKHTKAEDYQLGIKGPEDKALQMTKLSSPGGGEGRFQGPNGNLDEMKIFSGSGGRKITYLEVKDNGANCAKAIPINGGPGASFVVIHFTAPAGCRIDFDVELYGH